MPISILLPAVWLSGRIRFRGKLIGTFLVFAIPLAVLRAWSRRTSLSCFRNAGITLA